MDELSTRLALRDAATFDHLGTCTVPAPVEVDDLVALEHGEYRVVDVVVSPPGYPIEAIVKVRPVRLSVTSH